MHIGIATNLRRYILKFLLKDMYLNNYARKMKNCRRYTGVLKYISGSNHLNTKPAIFITDEEKKL